MKKIRILKVSFDTKIAKHEIPAFRGAFVDKIGNDHLLFHNHISDTELLYKYPLIQYKRLRGKPMILCLDAGVDEIYKYFVKADWTLKVSDRLLSMKIDQLNMHNFSLPILSKKKKYSINDWIALNQDNFRKFQKLEALSRRLEFLEGILKANILSFAKGVDWSVDKTIELEITNLRPEKRLNLKGNKLVGFDIDFSTNIMLPNYIGLGKSVSLGFGVVKQIYDNKDIKTQ